MVPTVVYKTDHACGLRMVVGGANGSRIITGMESKLSVLTKCMNTSKVGHSDMDLFASFLIGATRREEIIFRSCHLWRRDSVSWKQILFS